MVEVLANSAGRALGGIIAKFRSLKDMGVETYSKLYHNCVTPVMDYCAGVWGFYKNPKAEAVHNRAMRYYLGVHKFAPNLAVSGDMGWDPCKVRWGIEMLRFWNRLVRMSDDRLVKRVFNWDYNIQLNNWSSEINMLLGNVQMLDCFNARNMCNLENVRIKLMELECDSWKTNINNKPKLRTYVTFKHQYEREKYVEMNLSRSERSYLAQFRCGILPIRIETGRFRGEDVNESICTFCDRNEVEDEIHFMFRCQKFHELREHLINYVKQNTNNFEHITYYEKFELLMSKFPRQTAKFIKNAMNVRHISSHSVVVVV